MLMQLRTTVAEQQWQGRLMDEVYKAFQSTRP